ncbi:MAG: hypothetical protein J5911_03190 [Clostridia bacterium]|nr:hypothetical protein [Clostridia bacterium]
MTDYHNKSIDNLFKVISGITTVEECYAFFEDLCTIKEIQDMAQRLETAIMLKHGENYQNISAKVGVSSATISRVNRCLNYGSGGYKAAIEKLGKGQII